MTDIRPTHTCFEDVTDILKELMAHGHRETLLKALIVHAVCKFPSGRLYSHAWLEVDDACWFCGLIDGEKVTLSASPVRDFYEHYDVQELKKYTLLDLRRFGDVPPPYEEPFISLCGGGDKREEYKTEKQTK